ncbi:centrosomal protein of 192 kDa-like [Centruroides sculpturatus]|uniref:centrosomal protein of 192 kDa-like n=1 Tax=Centruroides sculpturatus TaxID=218467 RepID=UPI000C6D79BC|nr:centrosomal protein of 192 kDa-like [Centruroides sculpturatus]
MSIERGKSPISDILDVERLNLNNLPNLLQSTTIDNAAKQNTLLKEQDDEDIVSIISAKLGLSGSAKYRKSAPLRKAEKENEISVVYPTEEGNYVTDLAFETDLKKQFNEGLFSDGDFSKVALLNSEEFFPSDEAAKMLAKDEKDFEEAHMFEGETIHNPSLISMNSSWNFVGKQDITRPSWFSDKIDEDKSYMRISIGRFMQAKTEALGSLSGENAERPTFGSNFTIRDSKNNLKQSEIKDVQIELPRISANNSPQVSDSDSERETSSVNSVLSIKSISKLISEASLSDNPKELAERFLANMNAKKSKKKIHKEERKALKSQVSRSRSMFLSSQDSGIHSDLIKTNSNQELSSSSSSTQSKTMSLTKSKHSHSKKKSLNNNVEKLQKLHENSKSKIKISNSNSLIRKSYSAQTLFESNQNDNLTSLSKERTVSDTNLHHPVDYFVENNAKIDLNKTLEAPIHNTSEEDLDKTLTTVPDMNLSVEKVEISKNSSGKVEAATSPLQLSQEDRKNLFHLVPKVENNSQTTQLVESQLLYTTANSNLSGHSCSYHPSNVFNHQYSKCAPTSCVLSSTIPMAIPYGTPITSIHPTPYMPVTMNTNCFTSHGITNYCHGSLLESHNSINFMNTNQLQFNNSVCPTSTVSGAANTNHKRMVELRLLEPICVGDTKQFILILQNPTLSCLLCSLDVSVTIDKKVLPTTSVSGFVFPQHVQIESGATKKIHINYIPRQKGNIVAVLEVNTDSSAPVFGYPLTAVITAEVEWPKVSILMNRGANFGTVPECQSVIRSVKLVNHGTAVVPIRLQISEDFHCNHSFSFGVQEVNTNESKHCNSVWHFLSSKILFCRLTPQESQQTSEGIEFPLIFQSEKIKEGNLEQVSAILNATLESSVIYEALGSIRLFAEVGVVKFVIKESNQGIIMETQPKYEIHKSVLLENQGSVSGVINLNFKDPECEFKVLPHTLETNQGERMKIQLSFCPNDIGIRENILQAKFENEVYELLTVRGICKKKERRDITRKNYMDSNYNNSPIVLDGNIHYLTWGGVAIGDKQCKKLILRNASPTNMVQLKLFIKGDSSFQLEDNLLKKSDVTLLPLETITIKVVFAPKKVSVVKGTLYVKPITQEQNKFHYSFPLTGFGGICKLTLQGIDRHEDGSYYFEIQSQVAPEYSNITLTDFTLVNNGERAAFVKVLCYTDNKMTQLVPTSVMSVQPSEFVLQPQENLMVVIVFNHEVANVTKISSGILGIMYGEEILRQRLKSMSVETDKLVDMPFPLSNTFIFTSKYAGEAKISQDPVYQEAPSDVNIFYENLFRYFINFSVCSSNNIESFFSSDHMTELHESLGSISETSPLESLLMNKKENFSNLYSPPVKGCSNNQFSVLSNITADRNPVKNLSLSNNLLSKTENYILEDRKQENENRQMWMVEPSSVELGQAKRVAKLQFINLSDDNLRFRLISTLGILVIAPEQGIILARDKLDICIRLPSSYKDENGPDLLEGIVTVECNGTRKAIAIRIVKEDSYDADNSCEEYSHIDTLLDASDVNGTLLELAVYCPEKIDFPATEVGLSSQTMFTIRNLKKHSIHWMLYPCSRQADMKSQEVDPGSPQIFKLNVQNGLLKPREALEICGIFAPKEAITYSETWQLIVTSKKRTFIYFNGEGIKMVTEERHKSNQSGSTTKHEFSTRKKHSAIENGKQFCGRPIFSTVKQIDFPLVTFGESASVKIKLKNVAEEDHKISLIAPNSPFFVKYSNLIVKGKHYMNIPVSFQPTSEGIYNDVLLVHTELNYDIKISLKGEATSSQKKSVCK